VAYVAVLLWLTLAVLRTEEPVPNFVPFRLIVHSWNKGGAALLVNLVGNVVAFVPLGVLLPLVRRAPTSVLGVVVAGAALSAAIETLQYASGRRVADVDDVLLNASGALAGYALYLAARTLFGLARPTA
jgi:glycopeptide antibiotics resistance protein